MNINKDITKELKLHGILLSLLKNYNCDTLQIHINKETNVITITKCTLSKDYYTEYDYEYLKELTP